MEKEICEQLLEEYQSLRRRLEELDFTADDIEADENPGVSQADIDRLEELEERLSVECDVELPEDGSDLDLPAYAVGAPSEPRSDIEGE